MTGPTETTGTDVSAVRALAHPLRLRLLDLLRFEGQSTATRLARRVGESSGATSYHLRQLARFGYVEEAEGRGGRERWWRHRERPVTLEAGEEEPEAGVLLAQILSREAYALDRFLGERAQLPEWDAAAFFQSRALRLRPKELEDLRLGIDTLLAQFRRADDEEAPPDAVPVRFLAYGFPLPLEGP